MIVKSLIDDFEMDSRDFASIVLPDLDYDAQLIAIRHLFRVHENVDQELDREIKEIEEFAKNTKDIRDEYAVGEWVDRLHSSVYQSAAHSMSAVGMLAPLIESIFYQSFHGIRNNLFLFTDKQNLSNHIRWKQTVSDVDKWNCHFAWGKKSGKKEDLVRGIMQLSDATGLKPFLPHDLKPVLDVLFSYRNKMFHCGFEWPQEERLHFWERIKKDKWPVTWLSAATTDGKPWVIYLTNEFIWHCVGIIDQIIGSIGQYVVVKSGLSQQ